MSIKISRSEILFNKRLSDEDRQRELNRQRALKQVKATAHMYRNLPVEIGFSYQNSNGDHVSPDTMVLSLC